MTRNGNDRLWKRANAALHAGCWAEARQAIDDLNQLHAPDAVDALPPLTNLARGEVVCPEAFAPILNDRIALWNSHVERRASRILEPRMKREYLFALVFPRVRMLSLEQVQALRSEAHAQADHQIDGLCARALDGSHGALVDLSLWVHTQFHGIKE